MRSVFEQVTMQRTLQISDFSLLLKEPVIKWSACEVSEKVAIESPIAFSETRLFLKKHALIRILRDLAPQYIREIII